MEAVIPAFGILLLEEDDRRNHMRLHRRHLRDNQNPFEIPNDQFKYMFRVNKDLARNIIESIQPHIQHRRRSSGLPLHVKVLTTLNFLSRGSYQYCVGNASFLSLSQPSVSRAVSEVCIAITDILMPTWIKFPLTVDQQNEVKQGFYNTYGFRGVIGAIDGTHVNIVAPPSTDEEHPPHVYINRKGDYSINVMLVCDAYNTILCCDARYPGSVHDSAIYRMSDLRNHLLTNYTNGDHSTHLISDSGYPLEPWLFTPFQVAEDGTPEARFNNLLRSARNVIERTNGILKGRFRCLLKHRTLHYHPAKAAYIIYAACVIHNMAVQANLYLEEEDIEYEEEQNNHDNEPVIDNHYLNIGRNARQFYIQRNL